MAHKDLGNTHLMRYLSGLS